MSERAASLHGPSRTATAREEARMQIPVHARSSGPDWRARRSPAMKLALTGGRNCGAVGYEVMGADQRCTVRP
jgi:hypothetical protein